VFYGSERPGRNGGETGSLVPHTGFCGWPFQGDRRHLQGRCARHRGQRDARCAIATLSGQKDGKSVNDRYAHVVHMKDGLQTESWIFAENPDMLDDFWG